VSQGLASLGKTIT